MSAPSDLVAKAKGIFAPVIPEPAMTWLDHLQQFIDDLVFDSRAQPALAGILTARVDLIWRLPFASRMAPFSSCSTPAADHL